MNLQEHRWLQAEKASLERMLADLPQDRIIERAGLEARKQDIEEQLAPHSAPSREPRCVQLTFRGKPVVGSYGVFAEFGVEAVGTFTAAVTAIGASQAGPLGARGALPGRDEFRMLITGTAQGSFGFLLEEAPADDNMLFPPHSPLGPAVDQVKAIMQASLGTDDQLTEALAEADPRALDAVRKFIETLAKSEAVCALTVQQDVFRFEDVAQVRRSLSRLGQDNIHETVERLPGQFQGVLPHRRTFEFRVAGTGEIISGRVGKEIVDAAAINRILDQEAEIIVHSRRVGQSRPQYMLLSYEAAL